VSCTSVSAQQPVSSRCDVVKEWVERDNIGLRYDQLLAKIKVMAASLGNFYRGTSYLLWHDVLGPGTYSIADFSYPIWFGNFSNAQTQSFVCGDMHLNNFGSFDDESGQVIYSVNDFDESWIAQVQLDVLRAAVSIVLHAVDNGLDSNDIPAYIAAFGTSYIDTMQSYVGNDNELSAVFNADNTYGKLDDFLEQVEDDDSRLKMLGKFCTDSNPRVFDFGNPNLVQVNATVVQWLTEAWPAYGKTLSGDVPFSTSYFTIKSVAQRLNQGVASLGVFRVYVLIEGPSDSQDDDIILDVKYEPEPNWYAFLSESQQKQAMQHFSNQAERGLTGYRAFQRYSDAMRGWLELNGQAFFVRARSPWKKTLDISKLDSDTRYTKLLKQWAAILATNQARSDNDFNSAWIPYSVEQAVVEKVQPQMGAYLAVLQQFAVTYYKQLTQDYQCFLNEFPH
jgi:uncharacterized protein (DUF2252 family)